MDNNGLDTNGSGQPDERTPPEAAGESAMPVHSGAFGCRASIYETLLALHTYLLAVARAELARDLAGKVAPSDIVQETLLDVHKSLGKFRGRTREEFQSWLLRILRNNALNEVRRYHGTASRCIERETHLAARSGIELDFVLVDPSPGPVSVASSVEEEQRLLAGLARLPTVYREVIELHNREHLTFAEVGQQIGRSGEAARKLWVRALVMLREEMR